MGNNWIAGSINTIRWSAAGASSEVTLELYQDSDLLCLIDSAATNNGSYQWTVTDCGGGTATNYRIKVSDHDDSACFAFTGNFTITVPCILSISSPSSSQVCYLDSSLTIEWSSNSDDPLVVIDLYKGYNLQCTIDSTDNDGSYVWSVDNCDAALGTGYKIRVGLEGDPGCYSFSNYFTIVEPCSIQVLTPIASDNWLTGDQETITWNSDGGGANVRLDLYRSSSLVGNIDASTPNDGSYDWQVTDGGTGTGSNYRIKISDQVNPSCIAFSDYFTITQLILGTDDDDYQLPTEFRLGQNYPNPFNPGTTIEFDLPTSSYVTLTVYNLLGQPVRELVRETRSAGQHIIYWDGSDDLGAPAASGLYFYRLTAGQREQIRKMLLLR
jgi:hypothetical protein